jgi:flagellar biogenesis protein FliO
MSHVPSYRRSSILIALLCAVTFVPAVGPAHAQPISGKPLASKAENTPAARNSMADRNTAGGWWSTVGSLALVTAAILVLGVLLKWQSPGLRGLLPQSVVQDLGRRPLDPRNVVHLVRCGSKILVLGVGPQGLTALSEITDPVEVDTLTGLCTSKQDAEGPPQFGSILKRMLNGAPEAASVEGPDPASQRLKSRLQSLATPRATEAAHG